MFRSISLPLSLSPSRPLPLSLSPSFLGLAVNPDVSSYSLFDVHPVHGCQTSDGSYVMTGKALGARVHHRRVERLQVHVLPSKRLQDGHKRLAKISNHV